MQNKSSKEITPLQAIRSNTKSFIPVIRNGWIIKFSICGDNVLILFQSIASDEVLIRYFTSETEAVYYINNLLA